MLLRLLHVCSVVTPGVAGRLGRPTRVAVDDVMVACSVLRYSPINGGIAAICQTADIVASGCYDVRLPPHRRVL